MARAKTMSIAESLSRFGAGTNVGAYASTLGPTGEEPGRVVNVPLSLLISAPWQARLYESSESLTALIESIRREGLLHPITVRPCPERGAGEYQIVAGHRRFDALKALANERGHDHALATAPVMIRALSDVDACLLTLQENSARAALSRWEEARSIAAFRDVLKSAGLPSDTRSVGLAVGYGEGPASEYLRIAEAVTVDLLNAACATDADLDIRLIHKLKVEQLKAVARAPEAARPGTLRSLLEKAAAAPRPRASANRTNDVAESRRPPRYSYEQLRDEGGFKFNLTKPFSSYTPDQARAFLDDILPAVVALSAKAYGADDPRALGCSGPGTLVYLPTSLKGDENRAVHQAFLELLAAMRVEDSAHQTSAADSLEQLTVED